jgi:hypothetical protein
MSRTGGLVSARRTVAEDIAELRATLAMIDSGRHVSASVPAALPRQRRRAAHRDGSRSSSTESDDEWSRSSHSDSRRRRRQRRTRSPAAAHSDGARHCTTRTTAIVQRLPLPGGAGGGTRSDTRPPPKSERIVRRQRMDDSSGAAADREPPRSMRGAAVTGAGATEAAAFGSTGGSGTARLAPRALPYRIVEDPAPAPPLARSRLLASRARLGEVRPAAAAAAACTVGGCSCDATSALLCARRVRAAAAAEEAAALGRLGQTLMLREMLVHHVQVGPGDLVAQGDQGARLLRQPLLRNQRQQQQLQRAPTQTRSLQARLWSRLRSASRGSTRCGRRAVRRCVHNVMRPAAAAQRGMRSCASRRRARTGDLLSAEAAVEAARACERSLALSRTADAVNDLVAAVSVCARARRALIAFGALSHAPLPAHV